MHYVTSGVSVERDAVLREAYLQGDVSWWYTVRNVRIEGEAEVRRVGVQLDPLRVVLSSRRHTSDWPEETGRIVEATREERPDAFIPVSDEVIFAAMAVGDLSWFSTVTRLIVLPRVRQETLRDRGYGHIADVPGNYLVVVTVRYDRSLSVPYLRSITREGRVVEFPATSVRRIIAAEFNG